MSILEERYKDVNYCLRCGHKLEIVSDRENKIRPTCSKCGWVFYKNPIPVVCCLIINEKDEVVLIKRKFDPAAGKWAFPSGYMEIDQSPESAAIAEMKEETGLDGQVIRLIGYKMSPNPFYEKVVAFGFLMKVVGGELKAGDDAIEARLVPLNQIKELPFISQNYFLNLELEKRKEKRLKVIK
jgi:ADP-ribose pyrophosphatase YjhB (NUDIX family)